MGCPACGVIAHAHGRQRVELIDAPCFTAPVKLWWRKRRWLCPEPMCPVNSFMERDPDVAPRRALLTSRATSWAIGELPEGGPLVIAGLVLVELIGGTLLGLLIGFAGRWVLQRLGLSASGLFVLAVMGVIVLAYGLGILVHVSGFAAVYICAVVLGNSDLPHRNATKSFAEGVGWVAQIGLFVMLDQSTRIGNLLK